VHITITKEGRIQEREGALLESYLRRLDLTRDARSIARLVVERGRLTVVGMSSDVLTDRLACAAKEVHAHSVETWMVAARLVATSGWMPSKWTVAAEAAAEVHVHVHVTRW